MRGWLPLSSTGLGHAGKCWDGLAPANPHVASWEASHGGDHQHGLGSCNMWGCSGGITRAWRPAVVKGQPYLREREAMGLGMGLSFAECFAMGAW